MTDEIDKLLVKQINQKELQIIIQDNLINYNLCYYLQDEDILNSLIQIIYITYNEINSISNKLKDHLDKYNVLLKITIKKLLLSRTPVSPPSYSKKLIKKLIKHVEYLKKIPQPEQRTQEWYNFRDQRLTASDFGTALGINPYSTRDKLILKKCGHGEEFKPGSAIIHGVKYEDVAIGIYQNRNRVNVYDFGCLPHPNIDFIGASPDGICDKSSINKNYIGRMLEIKCPSSRPITGFPPNYYVAQVQTQLEVCDLEYCDFLECKILEYKNQDEYFNDGDELYQSNGLEKGFLIESYDIKNKKSKYTYGPLGLNLTEFQKWEDNVITDILDNTDDEYVATLFWKLDTYHCTLIKRDREWFKETYEIIKLFWDEVLLRKEKGVDDLLSKVYKTKTTYTKKKDVYTFLSDSDN